MASYRVKKPVKITRMAGTDFDIILTIDNQYSLTGAVLTLGIYRENPDSPIVLKEHEDMTIIGQEVTIDFAFGETANKHGNYKWQLQSNKGGKKHPIGLGEFELEKNFMD